MPPPRISTDELEALAEAAAELALARAAEIAAVRAADIVYDRILAEIGRITVRAVLYLGGAAGTALAAWFYHIEKIK